MHNFNEFNVKIRNFLSSEKFFIAIIVSIVFLFNLVPYVYQHINNPIDKTYIGSYPIVIDKPVYLAEMTQGKEGEWLFTYNYTTELKEKTPIYIFYIFLGHIAGLFNLPLETTFLLSRFFFGIILIFTIIYFIRYFINDKNQRKIAYFFVFLSSGLGFLIQNPASPDLWMPDFMPMVRFSYFPHMVLANILLLLIILLFFHSLKVKNIKLAIIAGFLSFILNIVLPYHNFVIYSLITLFTLIKLPKNKNILKYTILFFIFSLPSFIFMFYLGTIDPFWKEVAKENSLPAPNLFYVLTGYGLITIFSLLGLYYSFKNRLGNNLILFLWIFTTLILTYNPFIPMQTRILETGLYIPMAITASFGLATIYGYFKKINPKKYLPLAVLSGTFILPFLTFGNIMNWYVFSDFIKDKNDNRFYVSNSNIEAMYWLRQNSPSDSIILSSYSNGNLMPYYANRTTYVGHALMTLHFKEKMEQIEKFYSGKNTAENMRLFLKGANINYVFFSPEEQNISKNNNNFPFVPDKYNFLVKIYQNSETAVYKFKSNN